MKGQDVLFDLPPPGEKPVKFLRPQNPIWTENKAKLIERYLYYFVLVTHHGVYIDGFAAPQQNDKPESWAAKLVLESTPRWLREFWLCDIKKKGVKRLNAMVTEQPVVKGRRLHVLEGDFNQRIDTILSESRIDENTAAFCLLNQRTFECEWKTVERIARHKKDGRKIEIFYFLATGWLDRAIRATTRNHHRIERWWGQADWRRLKGMPSLERANLFCDRFKNELGYKHAHAWQIFSRETGGTVMYHMVHASDH
ncbi:MAG TPA: three-Cys-motif partner protein TcmP, partial [Xanthobacteraceae bacterium]